MGTAQVLLLRKVDHPNVIGYYTSFVEKKNLYILMEVSNLTLCVCVCVQVCVSLLFVEKKNVYILMDGKQPHTVDVRVCYARFSYKGRACTS